MIGVERALATLRGVFIESNLRRSIVMLSGGASLLAGLPMDRKPFVGRRSLQGKPLDSSA